VAFISIISFSMMAIMLEVEKIANQPAFVEGVKSPLFAPKFRALSP
jgi:hypothetical protein